MACPDTSELQALIEDALADDERERILAHTEACAECRQVLHMLRPGEDTLPSREPRRERELPAGAMVGRFRIEERLGQGAMGVVHAAHDPELDRRVAIKLVRPDPSDPDSAQRRARLQREAQALARVSHPNVMTVFDVGAHEGQLFIAMELVDGWTLREWQTAAPRDWREILACYLAAGRGLAAAHAVGVVHRDFKPDNVLIGRDGRVRVTDFGLARRSDAAVETDAVHTGSPGLIVTEAGAVVGTPVYMAPEQLAGEPADEASDQFSFCVALYEGLHGERPFDEHSLRALVDSARGGKLRPPPPGVRVPTALRQILACGLAPDPRARHPSMARLIELCEAVVAPPGRRGRTLAAVGLAGVLAASAVAFLVGRRTPAIDLGDGGARPGIAVLPLRNVTGEERRAWIAGSLAEMLSTELATGERLRTVPADTIQRVVVRGGEAAALAERLDARFLVTGSYAPAAAGRLRIDLRLEEPDGAGVLSSYGETVDEEGLVDVATRAAARFRARLRLPDLSAEETARARSSLPRNPEAARLYAEATERWRAGDAPAAVPLLEEAVARDPSFAQAHAQLAGILWMLGRGDQARAAASKALALAPELTREEQLLVEARAAEAMGDAKKAVEDFKILYGFFPDRHDYGVELLEALETAHLNDEARALIARLRAVGPPISDDPRLDRVDMFVAADVGEIERTIELATRVAERGRAEKMPYVVGDALFNLGNAAWAAGRLEDAEKAFMDLFELQRSFDDPNGLAVSLRAASIVRRDQGRLAEARVGLLEAIAIERRAGSIRARYAPATVADVAVQQGDLAGAEALIAGLTVEQTRHSQVHALIALHRGDLPLAVRRVDETVAQVKYAPFLYSRALLVRGRVKVASDDTAGARADFREALELATKHGYELSRVRAELSLARLALDEGEDPEPHLGAAAPAVRYAPEVAWARSLAARATRSPTAAAEARRLTGRLEDVVAADTILLEAAEVERDAAAAEAVRRRAEARGYRLVAFEARLIAARLGREPLAAVARDARAAGLARIARLAARRPAD